MLRWGVLVSIYKHLRAGAALIGPGALNTYSLGGGVIGIA